MNRRSITELPDWLRVALVPPIVVICHLFDWTAWRSLVTTIFVGWSGTMGIPMLRLSPDRFACNGHIFYFATSCTILDAFLGSVPLLWEPKKAPSRNLIFLAGYFISLSVANLLRLEAGFALYLRGVPWWLSHEVAAGFFYFGLFLWIARRRGWTLYPARLAEPQSRASGV